MEKFLKIKNNTLFLIITLLILLTLTGCASKQDYLDEVEKFKSALIEEEYILQGNEYYKGIGYECSADSPYAKTYSGTSSNGQTVTYYYCINSEKERPQKYNSINPENMEARFWSNKYVFDLKKGEDEQSDSYMLNNYTISFNLTYNAKENRIEGTYQEQKNSGNEISTYNIEYDYNKAIYSCKNSYVSGMNIEDDQSCESKYNDIFKEISTDLKNDFNDIISSHNIDSKKILDYIK